MAFFIIYNCVLCIYRYTHHMPVSFIIRRNYGRNFSFSIDPFIIQISPFRLINSTKLSNQNYMSYCIFDKRYHCFWIEIRSIDNITRSFLLARSESRPGCSRTACYRIDLSSALKTKEPN